MRVCKIANSDYFAMSVCLPVRTKQLSSQWTDFHGIGYLGIFRKSVEKIQVSLKFDKNNEYFNCTPMYIYDNISLNSPKNNKSFKNKLYMKSKHAFCVPQHFPENRAFCEVMWKTVAQPDRPHMTKWYGAYALHAG